MQRERQDDQLTHPSEQDGYISGEYLDRKYGWEYWTPERLAEAWRLEELVRAGRK